MEQQLCLIENPVPAHSETKPPMFKLGMFRRAGFYVCVLATMAVVVLTTPRVTNLRKVSTIRVVSLAEQDALTMKWLGAVNMSQDMADALAANLQSVQATADKVQKQVDAWAEALSVQNNKELMGYVEKVANASTLLNNVETEFKGWCFTQSALFETLAKTLDAKFRRARAGVAISIDTEFRLLDSIVAKSLETLDGMMKKIQNAKTDLSVVAAKARSMEREIKQQRNELRKKTAQGELRIGSAVMTCYSIAGCAAVMGQLLFAGIMALGCSGVAGVGEISVAVMAESWENSMTEQADTMHELMVRSTNLHANATTDYENMMEAKKHLDFLDALLDGLRIKDVGIFEAAVLPATKNLVKVLKSLGESQGFSGLN